MEIKKFVVFYLVLPIVFFPSLFYVAKFLTVCYVNHRNLIHSSFFWKFVSETSTNSNFPISQNSSSEFMETYSGWCKLIMNVDFGEILGSSQIRERKKKRFRKAEGTKGQHRVPTACLRACEEDRAPLLREQNGCPINSASSRHRPAQPDPSTPASACKCHHHQD